ncbi:MAG: chromosomal replication initiator protein DnaA [Hyphomicrobiales bacterium]|nr:chromosomal replication initiator protein DnaA [Hyphomicrobiales bacterium]
MTSAREASASFMESADIQKTDSQRAGAWNRVCQRLRAEFGEDVYASWFARLELDEVVSGIAHCSVPTKFLKSWIQSHYHERIVAVVSSELPDVRSIVIEVRSGARKPAQGADRDASQPVRLVESLDAGMSSGAGSSKLPFKAATNQVRFPAEDGGSILIGAPLDRRFSFDAFLIGESNRLAHAAAMRVANAGPHDPALYNPLYIHAAVGLGKTHLIQAIAHAAAAAGQRSIYLTAEKFMYGFVSALRAHTAIAYKERLRSIDKLIIDDVQFLRGKSIPQEFCHTLNALIDAGKQVVIAADRPPSELDSLDERVRSRLSGGLCVEMRPFDEALRVKVVEARVEAARGAQPGFDVPSTVIRYIANAIQTNGRDLDGAVNRLVAHATLAGAPLTVEMAESAIRDLIRVREPRRVKIEDIQKLVANHYSISRPDILSSRRTATVVRPRQIAMYLAKVLTLRSLPEIGRRFGGRDHTTVLHAVRKIEALAKTDGVLSEEIELLKRMLTEQ